jgi:hypothetical protein
MKLLFFVFILCMFNLQNANSQTTTLLYKLIVAGHNIGTVTAIKKTEGNKTTYTSNTDATANFIFTTEIKTRMTVVYKNDILQESRYTITHDDETNYYSKNISKSTIILLFELPNTSESYFEEVEGTFKSIKLIKENIFELLSKDKGQKDEYKYKNGVVQYSLVKNTLINFEMILKDK